MKKPKILVVGSFVMDLIVSTNRFPNLGETVVGTSFSTAPGGKGANQAVQAARLGAEVTMVGKLGNDNYGDVILKSLIDSGVDVSHIGRTDKAPTAIGNVQLQINEKGTDNRIIVILGANYEIVPEDVAFLEQEIKNYDLLILQQEIPAEINLIVAQYAKAANVPVMLNPAPYREIDARLLKCLTYISPNETEVEQMTGICPDSEKNLKLCIKSLRATGVQNALITLGKRGCVYSDGEELIFSSSVDCGKVLDTTAAGDSFVAAFCTALSIGVDINSALIFANCTAGITVSRLGAQPSLPTLDEVRNILKENNFNIKI